MAVSTNLVPFCGCPDNKSPVNSGSILGSLMFVSSHMTAERPRLANHNCSSDQRNTRILYILALGSNKWGIPDISVSRVLNETDS